MKYEDIKGLLKKEGNVIDITKLLRQREQIKELLRG